VADQAGYTGVVQSDVQVGYTGASGYTGIVHDSVASGYTGTAEAPVTAKPRAVGTRESTTAREPAMSSSDAAPRSPYDAAVLDQGEAPGVDEPLDYSLTAPGESPSGAASQADHEQTTGQADAVAAERSAAVADLASALAQAQQRVAITPEPAPNRALALAEAALRSGSVGGDWTNQWRWPLGAFPGANPGRQDPWRVPGPYLWSKDLLGIGSEQLRRLAADAIAHTRPTNLGMAYLQGIGLGLFDTAVGAAEGIAGAAVDPVGTAIEQASAVMHAIDDRIARGESVWEAANFVLNPLVRLGEAAIEANDLAGQALASARHGDWNEALRLSRDAGRSAASGGVASAEAVGTAVGALETAGALRATVRRLRGPSGPSAPHPPVGSEAPAAPRSPRPPEPQDPPSVPRPRNEVDPNHEIRGLPPDAVTGKVFRNGPERLPARPLERPHPANPQVPVFDRDYVRMQQILQEGVLDYERGVALGELERLPASRRLREGRGSDRIATAKRVFNELEQATALQAAVTHPDHGFLTQLEILHVRTPAGEVAPSTINSAFGKGSKGRIADHLDLAPDGTYTLAENKRWTAIVDSYSRRGGVQGGGLRPSSSLGRQVRNETNIFDYARRNQGSVVRVRGRAFDGRVVELDLNPSLYRGPAPTPYGSAFGE
jgi:hypothetical protein